MTGDNSPPSVRQEAQDIRAKLLVGVGALSIVIGLAAVGVAAWMLHDAREESPGTIEKAIEAPDRSALRVEQTRIEQRARGLRQREEAKERLHSWSWIDKEQRAVSIPIDQAMNWVVEEAEQGKLSRRPEPGDAGAEEDVQAARQASEPAREGQQATEAAAPQQQEEP